MFSGKKSSADFFLRAYGSFLPYFLGDGAFCSFFWTLAVAMAMAMAMAS